MPEPVPNTAVSTRKMVSMTMGRTDFKKYIWDVGNYEIWNYENMNEVRGSTEVSRVNLKARGFDSVS